MQPRLPELLPIALFVGHAIRIEEQRVARRELDRVPRAVFVSRPVNVQELGSGTLFRVTGNEANRVKVEFGRASAEAIEIRGGLRPGDQVIVSDTSQYERFDRLEIKLGEPT